MTGALLMSWPATNAQAAVPGPSGKPSAGPAVTAVQTSGDVSAKRKLHVRCEARLNQPHRSKGKYHILFKTRVKCKGYGANFVHVKVRGQLIRGHYTPEQKVVATSNQTQSIAVNGKQATYYTPKVKGKKIKASGYYKGAVTVRITSPVPGSSAAVDTGTHYVP
ncbi:hypothetical protein ACH4FX_42000 [Streptomyces sp. NPDC018019]|uniref:hypothetical protein n=1 Tax=Streptomyces sp. NPDC018019 TaxID=3365030 RepID=UPI00378FBE7C